MSEDVSLLFLLVSGGDGEERAHRPAGAGEVGFDKAAFRGASPQRAGHQHLGLHLHLRTSTLRHYGVLFQLRVKSCFWSRAKLLFLFFLRLNPTVVCQQPVSVMHLCSQYTALKQHVTTPKHALPTHGSHEGKKTDELCGLLRFLHKHMS